MIRFTTKTSLRAAALAVAMTAASGVASTAQAGWLADFLCWGDNQPALCRSHLPSWALNANLPNYSSDASALVMRAAQMKGDAKFKFIQENSEKLGGPRAMEPTKR